MTHGSWILISLVVWATGAFAQGTEPPAAYRCGPDGREYSASPCPDGKLVPVADRRTEEQRRQAEDVARRERELADRLTREREQRERAAPAAAGIGPAAKAPTAAGAGAKKAGRKKSDKPPQSPRRKKQPARGAA